MRPLTRNGAAVICRVANVLGRSVAVEVYGSAKVDAAERLLMGVES